MDGFDHTACRRCGVCCSSAFLALANVPADQDREGLARWLSYHGCEPMRYPGENGDVLAVKIPLPCKHLACEPESGKTSCLIYESRPRVCRDYLCDKAKEAAIKDLVTEHGVCL